MNQSSYVPDSFLGPDETGEKFETLKNNVLKSLESTMDDLKTMNFDFVNLVTDELLSGKFYSLLKNRLKMM